MTDQVNAEAVESTEVLEDGLQSETTQVEEVELSEVEKLKLEFEKQLEERLAKERKAHQKEFNKLYKKHKEEIETITRQNREVKADVNIAELTEDEKAEYYAQKALEKHQEQNQKRSQAESQAQKVKDDFQRKVNADKDILPDDFNEALSNSDDVAEVLQSIPDFTEELVQSKVAHLISYHLIKNPDEAEDLLSMTPRARMNYLNTLEARLISERLSKKSAKGSSTATTTKAPPPTPKGGGVGAKPTQDYSQLRGQAYLDAHRKGLI